MKLRVQETQLLDCLQKCSFHTFSLLISAKTGELRWVDLAAGDGGDTAQKGRQRTTSGWIFVQ